MKYYAQMNETTLLFLVLGLKRNNCQRQSCIAKLEYKLKFLIQLQASESYIAELVRDTDTYCM